MAFDRSKFIHRFIEDANDHLGAMNQGLLALEASPRDASVLDAVFRAAHTIKGSSRMMKLIHISDMAHGLEDVLDALRKEKISCSSILVPVLFDGMDTLSKMVEGLSRGEENPPAKELMETLKRAAAGEFQPETTDRKDPKIPGKETLPETMERKDQEICGEETFPETTDQEESEFSGKETFPETEVVQEVNQKTVSEKIKETIRVDVDKLDALINLMGEVVSSHKKIQAHAREIQGLFELVDDLYIRGEEKKRHPEISPHRDILFHDFLTSLHHKIHQLNRGVHDYLGQFQPLMSQMQERSLDLRMVPLSMVFDSLHMVTRDICRDSGKTVSLEISGGKTEMDKKMLELLKDPLLHMIRNCIDHGMEAEDIRLKAAKPAHGTIRISAGLDGGRVHICVADDGGGIPLDRVAAKALDRGIVTPSSLKEMGPSQVARLIFHPGLSTADIITDISGRGVGMDVVRQNIENELSGTISVDTTPGQGTIFHILLPETIAIIHVFMVTLDGVCYAVPAAHVTEIVNIPGNEIFYAQDKAVLRLRGELVPVVFMAEVLGHSLSPTENIQEAPSLLILIAGQGEDRLGMMIDGLISEEEQLVKPLPMHMRGLSLVTGAILSDIHGIIPVLHMMHMIEQAKKASKTDKHALQNSVSPQVSVPHILVVDDSITTREIEKSILQSHGYEVTLATDGLDGFNTAASTAFDLIVSDVDMPGQDGFALTEKLRATSLHAHTPIVLVTARDSQSDMKKGVAAGASAYIVKGDFDKNNLLETIENLLGSSNKKNSK